MFKATDARSCVEDYNDNQRRNQTWYKSLFAEIERLSKVGVTTLNYRTYNCKFDKLGNLDYPRELQFLVDELEDLGYKVDFKTVGEFKDIFGDTVGSIQLIISW